MLASFVIALRQSATINVQFETIDHINLLCIVADLRMIDLGSTASGGFNFSL
jgi:hypothetical protein